MTVSLAAPWRPIGLVLLALFYGGLPFATAEPLPVRDKTVEFEGRKSWNGWTYYGGPMHVMAIKPDREEKYVWLPSTCGLVRLDVAARRLRRWTTLDGLQDSFAYDVDFDRQGNVWVATYSGVSRLNGTSLRNWTGRDMGIQHHRFGSIAIDGDCRVWVGSLGDRRPQGAACLLPTGRWALYNTWSLDAEFPAAVSAIAADADGGMWIAGSDGKLPVDVGAGYYAPQTPYLVHVDRHGAPELVPLKKDFWISQLAVEKTGSLLAMAQSTPPSYSPAGGQLYRLALPGWIESGKDRTPDITQAKWRKLDESAGIVAPIRGLYRDRQREVWIATEREIGVLRDDRFVPRVALPAEKGRDLWRVAVLGQGQAALFCVNRGSQDPGVFLWSGGEWTHLVTPLDGPVGPGRGFPVIGIHGRDLQGRLHFIRDSDTVFDGKTWTAGPVNLDFVYDKSGRPVANISHRDAKPETNLIWLKERGQPVAHKEFFGVDYFPARFRDSRGHYWAYGFKYHGNDLLEFDGKRIIDHAADNRYFLRVINSVGYNPTVRAVAEDGRGGLWLATTTGLLRHRQGTTWEWVGGRFDGMAGMMGWHVHGNGRETLAYAGSWGTSEYDMLAGQWRNFTQQGRSLPGSEPRLPGSYVEAVASDVQGRMWYGTYEGGIACRDAEGRWEYYTTADGLACNACWGIWCDDDGLMWFSSEAGAQSLDLKTFRRGVIASPEAR